MVRPGKLPGGGLVEHGHAMHQTERSQEEVRITDELRPGFSQHMTSQNVSQEIPP